jgi:hypothetical protein
MSLLLANSQTVVVHSFMDHPHILSGFNLNTVCTTGDLRSVQQKLHDQLLPVQEHLPYMGPRRVPLPGPGESQALADIYLVCLVFWTK